MANNNDGQGETPAGGGTPFEQWLTGQTDEVRQLIDGHVAGLKSALQSERDQRKNFEADLKAAIKAAGENQEARDALKGVQDKLAGYQKQVGFYEAATAAGVKNLRLAYLAAQQDGLIADDGTVKLESLKVNYPELFGKTTPPPGNAGAGTGSLPPGKVDMDSLLRSGMNQS